MIKVPVKKADFDNGIAQIAAGGIADMFQLPSPDGITVGALSVEEPLAYSDDGETVYIGVETCSVNGTPVEAAPAPETPKRKARAPKAASAPAVATAPGEPKIYRGGKGRPPAWWGKLSAKQQEHYKAETTTDAIRLKYMQKFGGA